jgi:hypothetical protein
MLRVVLIVSVALLSLYRALIGCERRAPPLLGRDRALYAWKKTRGPIWPQVAYIFHSEKITNFIKIRM